MRVSGHRGAWVLWRMDDGRAEIVTVSLWESRSAIEAKPDGTWPGRPRPNEPSRLARTTPYCTFV